ncbi:MAG: GGDEF domain-containing protein [Solirubrobacteraceae bacterium]
MEGRIRPARRAHLAVVAVGIFLFGPQWSLAFIATAAIGFWWMERKLPERRRPEYSIAAAWCVAQIGIGVGIALTGGPTSYAIAWLAIPVATLPARFSLSGVISGVGFTLTVLLVATVAPHPADAVDNYLYILCAAVVIVSIAVYGVPLMTSDTEHRSGALIDPLTGLLNRAQLETRYEELAYQAKVSGQPLAMLMCDIDHFKGVNDGHGHAAGDAVLRDAAYAIRRNLRPFDVVYRLGGEEFLAILPGTGPIRALAIAERLRSTVELGPTGGVPITVSVGVSVLSPDTEDRSYETMFSRADGALYAAKAAGRNQVVTADPPGSTSNRLFVREERRRRIAEAGDAPQAPQAEDA